MKIVHVIISCFYREGYGYQENLLPAKHSELGYETSIIAHVYGNYKSNDYVNDNGVPVHILSDNNNFLKKIPVIKSLLPITVGLYSQLEKEAPDIIFIHGLQAIDNLTAIKYLQKHPNVRLFADQHGDYYNMPMNSIKQKFMQRIIYKYIAQKLYKHSQMIWGVTPWRVKFIREVYKLGEEKTGLLVMGGDEKLVNWKEREKIREVIRQKYSIPQDAFVLVSGGKIDRAKNIHLLIEAVNEINNVFLLIFGRYEEDMASYISKINNPRIVNIGWIKSSDSYEIFHAADLAVFPGTHSVLWEQSCASGIPGIFKDWDGGFNHIDVGGNCILISNPNKDSLKKCIESIVNDTSKYNRMKASSQTKAREYFSYRNIAKAAILEK